jgi:hypothetical protein
MDPVLIMFPQDNIREQDRRLRHYYKYDPQIRTIMDLHTETPISDFELRCPGNREAQNYFNDFKDRVNLVDHIINLCRDYWLLGEGFLYGNWDDNNVEFSGFVQLPPEDIEVHSAYILPNRVYVLRPNKNLSQLTVSRNPAEQKLMNAINDVSPLYARALRENKPFILDPNRLVVMQRSMAGYSNRGISPVMAAVKDLLFQDYLIMYRMVFIQRHSFPLKIFKLGDPTRGYVPPATWYENFRQLLARAKNDPDFNIITHSFVQTEVITGHDKFLPLIQYFDSVKARIFMALFVSDAIITGEKTPYASGVTFMKGLMNRYLTFRNNLANELGRKVFANLSRMRGFYTPTQAEVSHRIKTRREERLVLPKIHWEKANLLSNQAIQQFMINLRDKKEIPMKYVCEVFGWDFDDMLQQMRDEEATRADPVWQKMREKLLTDPKAKLNDLAKKVLLGEDLVEAYKAQLKDKIKTDEEAEQEKTEKDEFSVPEVAGPSGKATPELSRTVPEMPIKPSAPAEVGALPEARPRPGEAAPETVPPGTI